MKKIILITLVSIIVIFGVNSLFAVDADKDIKVTSVRTFAAALAKKKMGDLLTADQHPVRAGEYLVKEQGFTATDSYWGMEIKIENKAKKTLMCVILMQDYTKKNVKDFAAVGHTTITVDTKTEVFPFGIIATGGKIENYSEFYIDPLRMKVLTMNSFLKSISENISAQCKSCSAAAGKCTATSWTSYLACISKECGECFAKGLAAYACGCAKICSDICGCAGR